MSNIEKGLRNLNTKKASIFGKTPPKVLRASKENCSENLAELFNNTLLRSCFLIELTIADVSPVFKKDYPLKTKNYRPVSLLPVVSKILKKTLAKTDEPACGSFPVTLPLRLSKRI